MSTSDEIVQIYYSLISLEKDHTLTPEDIIKEHPDFTNPFVSEDGLLWTFDCLKARLIQLEADQETAVGAEECIRKNDASGNPVSYYIKRIEGPDALSEELKALSLASTKASSNSATSTDIFKFHSHLDSDVKWTDPLLGLSEYVSLYELLNFFFRILMMIVLFHHRVEYNRLDERVRFQLELLRRAASEIPSYEK
jgi:hypothetical protein